MPYNYLIDSRMRKSQGIDLKDAIVIIDEAHNIESSCGDATSIDLIISDLISASEELETLYQYSQTPGALGDTTLDPESIKNLKGFLHSNFRGFASS